VCCSESIYLVPHSPHTSADLSNNYMMVVTRNKRMKLHAGEQYARKLMRMESECPLCLDILVKTVSLHPCGHCFCGDCAEKHLKATSSTTAIAEALSKKLECPTCMSEICGFSRNRAIDGMIWAAALKGTFEREDAMQYLNRREQAGAGVATQEEKECVLGRSDEGGARVC